MKYEWEAEIRKGLGTPQEVVVEATPEPVKQSSGFGGWLAIIVILLTMGLVIGLYHKDPTFFGIIKSRGVPEEAQPAPLQPLSTPDFFGDIRSIRDDLGKLKAGQDKLDTDVDALQKRTRVQGDRIIIMGTVINDNSQGQKMGDTDPLYLNHDWTIPREPRYLKINPEDADFIRRHVRPPN